MVTLEESRIFSHLAPRELELLREHVRETTVAAGEEIFKEGDAGDGVYVVREGAVDILVRTALGAAGRLRLTRVEPGDVFGELTLLDQEPRSAFAVASENSRLFFVPREPLVALLNDSPHLVVTLVQEIIDRLREFNRVYVTKVLEAERMALIGRFASAVVHDLKNPLTVIGIAAQSACRDGATSESRRQSHGRITKMVDRITSLVNDILEYTRGSTGAMPLYKTDYGEFVESVALDLQPDLEAKGVALKLEKPPQVALLLNPKRLSRVFYNLVNNATDAMPEGGTITVRFAQDGPWVVTEVEDEGDGIAQEILPLIFDAFATFGKTKGTGLGLAICHRIIEEHHGAIKASNAGPGGGAVFSFSLPS